MTTKSYEREYHLTPRGWMEGTCVLHDKIQGKEVVRPGATVLTLVCHKDSELEKGEQISWEQVWISPIASQEDIAKLYEHFGPTPRD